MERAKQKTWIYCTSLQATKFSRRIIVLNLLE
jgi:hypothetical protein